MYQALHKCDNFNGLTSHISNTMLIVDMLQAIVPNVYDYILPFSLRTMHLSNSKHAFGLTKER